MSRDRMFALGVIAAVAITSGAFVGLMWGPGVLLAGVLVTGLIGAIAWKL